MTTKRQQPWAMASLRHRQTPRKYREVGPIGDAYKACPVRYADSQWQQVTCPGCGYHSCSCETFSGASRPALKPQLPITLDKSNVVHCYPHDESWDRLTGTGCIRCQAEKREPRRYQICWTHNLWSFDSADTCALCTIINFKAKSAARAALVQADMQPVMLSPESLKAAIEKIKAIGDRDGLGPAALRPSPPTVRGGYQCTKCQAGQPCFYTTVLNLSEACCELQSESGAGDR